MDHLGQALEKVRKAARRNAESISTLLPYVEPYCDFIVEREMRIFYETFVNASKLGIETGSPKYCELRGVIRRYYPTSEEIATKLIKGEPVEFPPQRDGIRNGHHD